MNFKPLNLLTMAFAALLASCGGGGSGEGSGGATQPQAQPALTQDQEYQALLTEANAAKAEAVSLAASGPCTADDQCSTLTFRSPLGPCNETSTTDYSLVSAGAAAASAAAARYERAASEAEAIAPPTNVTGSCFVNVDATPLICLENSCQRGFRF